MLPILSHKFFRIFLTVISNGFTVLRNFGQIKSWSSLVRSSHGLGLVMVVKKLRNMKPMVNTAITLRKLKTVLPSLKSKVPKHLRSNVVYKIECPGCAASYVGQTFRHLTTRFTEHCNKKKPVGAHFTHCIGTKPHLDDIKILDHTTKGTDFLETLEALHINEHCPEINTREEYRSRTLTLKFWVFVFLGKIVHMFYYQCNKYILL